MTSRGERPTSFELEDFGPVSGREEEWRFTPVDRLAGVFAAEFSGTAAVTLAGTGSLPDGVKFEQVPRSDPRLGQASGPSDRAAAAAWAGFGQATVLSVGRGISVESPIELEVRTQGDGVAASHLAVWLEENSAATVIVDYGGGGELAETVELYLGEGARLRLLAVGEWAAGAVHASSHRARLAKDASLVHSVAVFGGELVRITPDVTFAGPGGSAELLGLALTDSGEHHESRLFVDHAAPRCTSRVTYKGALQGAGAHSVWVGDVLIRAGAVGTDTYEQNRNLVLVRGARADSVPNLEIETGEILGAGHASATGRFDDEQVFYLCSRGIDLATARRLVVHAFFAELVGRLNQPEIEARLIATVDRRLDAATQSLLTPTQQPKETLGR
ncbi:MAG: Fe-S cluster assembly protein SufD [Bifidobacteriaceae bacterium]|nr:Fe-S cluster assembly protein SufD [Bifidobacteriaceae bacterium]